MWGILEIALRLDNSSDGACRGSRGCAEIGLSSMRQDSMTVAVMAVVAMSGRWRQDP